MTTPTNDTAATTTEKSSKPRTKFYALASSKIAMVEASSLEEAKEAWKLETGKVTCHHASIELDGIKVEQFIPYKGVVTAKAGGELFVRMPEDQWDAMPQKASGMFHGWRLNVKLMKASVIDGKPYKDGELGLILGRTQVDKDSPIKLNMILRPNDCIEISKLQPELPKQEQTEA